MAGKRAGARAAVLAVAMAETMAEVRAVAVAVVQAVVEVEKDAAVKVAGQAAVMVVAAMVVTAMVVAGWSHSARVLRSARHRRASPDRGRHNFKGCPPPPVWASALGG